ncbi:hypothetical protein AB832_03560 [Flavobacteriaceae bacterium (ex Bugula neritina AB1)]|nr:hypothetical protein AB832_03560 [Flavobacteriaceae bacterium (ex Bugula neritina AB1)]
MIEKLTWQQKKEVERVNKRFDKQIAKDKKYAAHKELFNLSLTMSLQDWKAIRTANYWSTHDKIHQPDDRILFTLIQVRDYLNL